MVITTFLHILIITLIILFYFFELAFGDQYKFALRNYNCTGGGPHIWEGKGGLSFPSPNYTMNITK